MTSTDRLYNEWQGLERARLIGSDDGKFSHIEDLLKPLGLNVRIVTVIDAHQDAAWVSGVRGHPKQQNALVEKQWNN